MSTAIDMRVFETSTHIRSVWEGDELDVCFIDTFDQAVTTPGTDEPFAAWCEWFGASFIPVHTENDIALGLLTFCPFFRAKEYKDDALYAVGCMMHGSEESYLKFLTTGT